MRILESTEETESFGVVPPSDDEFERNRREFMRLQVELYLAGTPPVHAAFDRVVDALHAIGEEMRRLTGGLGERFHTAYHHRVDGEPLGNAVTATRARLISVMRDDVTLPHLPEPRHGA